MPRKTVQQLDAYIQATAVVYDHSNAKLISRKTKVKPKRKQAFLSVLHYRKTSSDDCCAKRRPSKRWIRRKSRQTHESQSNTKDVKQKLQVFVRTPPSHKSKTLYFELHPETSVSSLKEVIQKKISVEARHQRLYIRENVQLCDLLTLEENGVDKDELISLRLSLDDANDDDVPKDKASIDDEYLRDLSSKIEISWKELAKHLGYEEAEIADMETTNEGSTEGSRHMLLTWWEKTTDPDEAAQKLRRALEAIGLTDLAQNVPVTSESREQAAGPEPERRQDAGVDEESKQNGAASTEEEHVKNDEVPKDKAVIDDEYLKGLSPKIESSWKELAKHLGYEDAEIADIQTTNEGSTEESRHMLLTWWEKTTDRDEAAQKLRRALEATGLTDLAQNAPVTSECRNKAAGPEPERRHDAGVDEESKQNLATSTEEEKLKKEQVGNQDKPRLFSRRYVQVFIKSQRSQKPKIMCLQVDPETSVLLLKVIISEKMGVHPQQQRMYIRRNFRNFELHNLLTLHDCGIHQDEIISLRLCTDGLLGGGPKDKHPNDDQFFRGLASKAESSWEKLARSLGYEEDEIKQFQKICQENKERSLQMLLSWWRKQTNREEGFQSLRDALNSIGRAELALMIHYEEQRRMKHEEIAEMEKRRTSSQGRGPRQQETALRDKLAPQEQLRGAEEQREQKETTSSENQRTFQEDVTHQDKHDQSVQMRGAKDQSRKRGATSSEDQRPEQEEVTHGDEPQPSVQVRGAKEHSRKRGATSSEDQRPEQEEVTQRDKTQPQAQMGVAKKKIKQNETTSSEDQRQGQQEAAHRDKPQPEVQVRGAKEQSRKRGATSSDDQRPEQDEVAHRDEPQPKVQVRGAKEQSRRKGASSSEDQSPEQEEVAHRDKLKPPVQVGMTGTESRSDYSQQSGASIGSIGAISGNQNPVVVGSSRVNITYNSPLEGPAEVGRAQTSSSDAAADQCRSELKDRYTTTGSYVQLIPWVDDDMKHMRDIYTELELEKGDQDDIEGDVKEYGDIFLLKTRYGKVIKRAILCGSAGMGKSTIIDKMAYDWATGVALGQFSLVFVLKMFALKQTSDLVESVFSQLLADDTAVDKGGLEAFIKVNGSRVLILIDGFDEFGTTNLEPEKFGSILRMLNRKFGKECFVVVTTRPSHFAKLKSRSLIGKPFTHVKVLGFKMEDIGQYVRNFFPARLDAAEGLLDRIQSSDVLSDLARSPMILLLMCLIWREEKTLPDTLSRLFSQAIKYIFQRKMPEIPEKAISEIVISIGRVAFKGLVSPEQRLSFQEGEFEKSALDKAIQAGILTSQRVIKWRDTHNNVQFIHKTLQEYCAAMYCQSLLSKGDGKFQKILDKLGDARDFEYMLRFCCGDDQQCTRHTLRMLHEKNLQELALKCYFESQSRDLLSVDIIESFFKKCMLIDNYSNDSLNSFLWLLQHVAEQTKLFGVDYLAKVSEIHLGACNLSRFSEVVAFLLPTMKNLRVLDFDDCTLTGSNVNTLLSSFRNGGNLTEISLGMNVLGGSAEYWAVQLRGMKYLAKLSLDRCRLDPRDVVDIALSIGEMPNLAELNLSGNKGLGGTAETWAASLQKMIHLKKLDMRGCGIISRDVKYIAESVGRMQNLVDCDFSSEYDRTSRLQSRAKDNFWRIYSRDNPWIWCVQPRSRGIQLSINRLSLTVQDLADVLQSFSNRRDLVRLTLANIGGLGGSASIWTPLLQNLTELQELELSGCSLQSADIEHLAAALGQMQNLADLNLSKNLNLGGHVGTWAASLKRVIHLKSLDLSSCDINEQDLSHIASSVRKMPNLADLSLSYTKGLGSHAGTGAACLQKMIHLKSLGLWGCDINEQDLLRIASSVGKMPDLAHLSLSWNEGLGGHAGTWAACLQKMIHLNSLYLWECNINGQDLSHIASSVGRMPNLADLNLSGNEGLGGNAKTWAASLKKMTHLKSLNLSKCGMNEQDLPHIASSVGEMSNLADLKLSRKWDFSRTVGTWPASLQRMIDLVMRDLGIGIWDSSAEECRVQPCDNGIQLSIQRLSLTGKGMADILQSFSIRRDLVMLTLRDIHGLGGSAEIWTPPLQNMTELQELDLNKCSLQSTDIEPLAAAVSRMPTLESLSLERNRSLIGSAQTWARCLKQMKHVRSLKLGHCSLTEEDKKHIFEAWGSEVDFWSSEDD